MTGLARLTQNRGRRKPRGQQGAEVPMPVGKESLYGRFWETACASGPHSRRVQDILKGLSPNGACPLTQGEILELLKSPQRTTLCCASTHMDGNFVLEEIIKLVGVGPLSDFIVDELWKQSVEVAKSKCGYRIYMRIAEHWCQGKASSLIDHFVRFAPELCKDKYGHYVIESVLDHGTPNQKEEIRNVIKANYSDYANDQVGRHVVLKANLVGT